MLIPPLYRWAALALAVVLGALAVAAWDSARIKRAEARGAGAVRAEYAKRDAATAAVALEQANRNAQETERRMRAQKEAQDAHDRDLARARADAAAARAAAGRLSGELAAFTARHRGATGNPPTAVDGQAAGSALDLLANLLSRADAEAGILAEFADAAHAAGLQCQRAYQALTP